MGNLDHHPSYAYSTVFRLNQPFLPGFLHEKEAFWGNLVPASEKFPQLAPHKHLILPTFFAGGTLIYRSEGAEGSLLYRFCAAGRPGDPGVERLSYTCR